MQCQLFATIFGYKFASEYFLLLYFRLILISRRLYAPEIFTLTTAPRSVHLSMQPKPEALLVLFIPARGRNSIPATHKRN